MYVLLLTYVVAFGPSIALVPVHANVLGTSDLHFDSSGTHCIIYMQT